MRAYFIVPVAALALGIPFFAARDARACGGCYHKASETETTVVTGHKMVLSISTTQTVLWDQIEYDGNPSDFAWVLPVKKGAYVELATDAWFEALDAATSPSVVGPRLDCPGAPGVSGGGCGTSYDSGGSLQGLANSAEGDGSGSGAGNGHGAQVDPVTVVHRGTIGPYATVTLATDTPGALNDWLTMNGYAVDPGVQPVIDAYIAEDFDFIALRLQPGKDVHAMKPVRVITQGASPTLPLRMVAAGTGAFVGISLFVISEGRYATKNFPGAVVSTSELSWDHLTSESNYAELRKAALDKSSGHTWLTGYAKVGPILSSVKNPASYGNINYRVGEGYTQTIADAYFAQATLNDETMIDACPPSATQFADSVLAVSDPCPPDAMDPTQCPAVPADKIDARDLACGVADDLAVALTGLHPRDVWLTRLDAFLPHAALATDLELEPDTSQAMVENWLMPTQIAHEAEACRQGLDAASAPAFWMLGGRGGGSSGSSSSRSSAFALIACGLAALAMARRAARAQGAQRSAAARG